MMEFCKQFNARTGDFKETALMRVKLQVSGLGCLAGGRVFGRIWCCSPMVVVVVVVVVVIVVVVGGFSQAFEDRSFKFDVLPPPTSWYLKRVTGLAKGSKMPGKEVRPRYFFRRMSTCVRVPNALFPCVFCCCCCMSVCAFVCLSLCSNVTRSCEYVCHTRFDVCACVGVQPVGNVSLRALYEIALSKQQHDPSLAPLPVDSLVRSLCASAKSMGLKLVK